jgi:hypothetical protein
MTDSLDHSTLPSYNKKSLSPLRYANEDHPEDFQAIMDMKNA